MLTRALTLDEMEALALVERLGANMAARHVWNLTYLKDGFRYSVTRERDIRPPGANPHPISMWDTCEDPPAPTKFTVAGVEPDPRD